ncbi:SBBP repeat-containing protein [bacterium]|nr:SBBP repeat-containing protein [bacterium]
MKTTQTKWLILVVSCLAIGLGSCKSSTSTDETASSSNLTCVKVATDASHDVYLGGHTATALDSHAIIGETDIFLIKYTADGTRAWSTLIGSTSGDYLQGMTITTANQVLITGYTYGTLTGNTNSGGVDMLLVKTAADGSIIWEKQFGTAADDYAYGITTDATGDIYLAGHTYGSFAATLSGTKDFVLLKLDNSGNQVWSRQLSNDEDSSAAVVNGVYGIDVKTDAAGNVYAAGFTTGQLAGNTSSGKYDLFVVKYDGLGNLIWVRQLGSVGNDYLRGMQVNAAGDVYLTGYTDDALAGQTYLGEADLFLVKLGSDGTIAWIRQPGTVNSEYANGIALDSSGDVFLAGSTTGYLTGTSLGGSDLIMLKYGSTGTPAWTIQMGTAYSEAARAIAIDASGDVYITGYTYGALDGNANPDLVYYSFLSRYNAAGVLNWTRAF